MNSIKGRVGLYEIVETLGSGSFGTVKLAKHLVTQHQVALKFINKSKMVREGMSSRVDREIAYLQVLRHPHIIKLYEVVHTNSHLVMVMEYAGGELFQYIADRGRMSQDEASRFFQQVITAVEYCHEHDIVHRDLKPENLLLDARKNLKLADFGLSNTMYDGNFLKTSCGSPNYAAPEVIAGKLYAGPEVDVWSCGVILYVMLVGRLPFDDEYIPTLFHKVSTGVYQVPNFLSKDAVHLLSCMLQIDPLQRITIPEIRVHPFFTSKLPDYLRPHASSNTKTYQANAHQSTYDMQALSDLASKIGQNVDVVRDCLETCSSRTSTDKAENDHPLQVAYRLCIDARMLWINGQPTKTLGNVESIEKSPNVQLSPEAAQPSTVRKFVRAHNLTKCLNPTSISTSTGSTWTLKKKTRSRWHVGIRSRSHAVDVMLELFKALGAVGCDWKLLGAFAIRARYLPSGVKLDMQLFRVEAGYYLVDFKRVITLARPKHMNSPPPCNEDDVPSLKRIELDEPAGIFEFFDLTARIIIELARTS